MKKQWFADAWWYVFGSICFALSVSVFAAPNNIAPGGTAGLGVIMQEVFGIPIGTVVLLVNIPLLIAAFFVLGKAYACRSALVIVLSSVIMDVSAPLLPAFHGERLLAALCGGLLSGIGIGAVMLRGASTGGGDIVAGLWQHKRPHLSIGRLVMAVDAAVIALSAVVFGELTAALYAGIQVFVASVLIDHILYGQQEGRLLLVVSRMPSTLAYEITTRLSRGVTMLEARGGYTGNLTGLLLCAVSRTQVPSIKRLVHQTDPAAFVMVVTTEQVLGEGFLSP